MAIEAGAVVFDLDRTLLEVTPLGKPLLCLRQRNNQHNSLTQTRKEIANLDIKHSPVESFSTSLSEHLSLQLIARSKAFPGVADEIKRLIDEGFDLFIDTGRPNKLTWADVTMETLDRAGILNFFKEIFYKPPGVSSTISKAHALHLLSKKYNTIEFNDDEISTAHFIASIFPEIGVNLVQKKPLRTNLEKLPNLKIIPSIVTRQGAIF